MPELKPPQPLPLAGLAAITGPTLLGLESGTGPPVALSAAQARTAINVLESSLVNGNSVRMGPNAGASWQSTISGSTAVGNTAMQFATTAGQCTAFGSSALRSNLTGFGNTAIGVQALNSATGAEGTAVGRQAGLAVTTGVGNTLFGYNAGDSITTGGSNTLIGRQSDVSAGTIANGCALGNGAIVAHSGSVALGQGTTTTAAEQVAIGERDLEVQASDHGVILRSPDATRWRITVDNSGILNTAAL